MRSWRWILRGTLGLLTWAAVGLGIAHAGVISPVNTGFPFAPKVSAVTISILKNGVDVTDTWLPEPGQTVQIVVNGLPGASPSLVLVPGVTNPIASKMLSTSAYAGQCTNFANPALAANAPDFELSGNNNLTPTDCGGMAVVQVSAGGTPELFILPQDSNFNGIPDIWEAIFCPGNTCPTGKEDGDKSANNLNDGDGISAFDEYRGFIVSGIHVRTDPRKKTLFVHVRNPECGTDSLIGGGTSTFVTGDALFANLDTLLSGVQIHRLGYSAGASNGATNEWDDRFISLSASGVFQFRQDDGTTSSIAPLADRRINVYAVNPILDAGGNPIAQKGVRVIECVVNDSNSTMGVASITLPNNPGNNAIIYTRRILNYYDNVLGAAPPANLCHSTYVNGAATTPVAILHNDLIGVAIRFVFAMEVGHSLNLTPTEESTTKLLCGRHHCPGTGSNLDQAVTNKSGAKCGNLFTIPRQYNSSDFASFRLK